MAQCICSTCKHLKTIIEDLEATENVSEVCEFGFPSEDCEVCEAEGCTLTCNHYVEETEDEQVDVVHCTNCDKALNSMAKSEDVGEVYCTACYLERL